MEIVIDDVLGDALVAKRDKVGDSLLELVDLVIMDPRGKLFVDRSGSFLKNERGVIKIELMDDVEFIRERDCGVRRGGMEMEVKKACLIPEIIECDLIALEVPVFFPEGFFDSFFSKRLESIENRNFRGPERRGMVGVLEKLEDILAVFREKRKALVALIVIMKRLI